jgi:hydroxyacylglutathione hydrolase
MESSCFLLLDGERQHCVFTGDTLFLGEVGRPDLAVKSDEITSEDLAGLLYDSLRNKIMKLDPKCIVYPAHGAGSPCGKNISTGTYDVLSNQLKTNYALQDIKKEDFIALATLELPKPPQYFGHDVALNKGKAASVEDILRKSLVPTDLPTPDEIKAQGIVLLDTRTVKEFEAGYIPGSVSLPLSVNFAIWSGTLFKPSTKFFIIASTGKERESVIRLARIGYDNILGVLKGGLESYRAQGKPVETLKSIEAWEVTTDMFVVDVRNPPELIHGHLEGVRNVPLIEISKKSEDGSLDGFFPKDCKIYVHCRGGARSIMACSMLSKHGYSNQVNINGGFDQIKKDNK